MLDLFIDWFNHWFRDVDNSRKAGKIPGCQSDFPSWKSTYHLWKAATLAKINRLLHNLHFHLWQILSTSLWLHYIWWWLTLWLCSVFSDSSKDPPKFRCGCQACGMRFYQWAELRQHIDENPGMYHFGLRNSYKYILTLKNCNLCPWIVHNNCEQHFGKIIMVFYYFKAR